jgi:hypothetical protein
VLFGQGLVPMGRARITSRRLICYTTSAVLFASPNIVEKRIVPSSGVIYEPSSEVGSCRRSRESEATSCRSLALGHRGHRYWDTVFSILGEYPRYGVARRVAFYYRFSVSVELS